VILIVDDNPAIGEALLLLLEINQYHVSFVDNPEAALNFIAQNDVSLVIQDMNFKQEINSGAEGQELFYKIRSINPDLPIILMTAWANLGMAVELVKAGAADYISKPWDDNKLLVTIANLLQLASLQAQNNELEHKSEQQDKNAQVIQQELQQHELCGTIFQSSKMQRLIDMAVQVAPTDVPILITGPNGSGKEKIAEIIQANSRRSDKAFIKVNVGALSSELLEAELFGAEKGAYTGADKRRIGRFEAADGGTLFLDEMGNLPLSGQHKLLRILQSGEFERVGSSVTQKVDVRIITATNENLSSAIAEGSFREDLYYRLNVIELRSPPLADRSDDILPLAYHFLQSLSPVAQHISERAEQALKSHLWPGNVRELYNRIQRAALLCTGDTIETGDLDLNPAVGGNSSAAITSQPVESTHGRDEGIRGLVARDVQSQSESLVPGVESNTTNAGDLSIEQVQQALDKHGGVVARAARELGISRQALYRRLSKA